MKNVWFVATYQYKGEDGKMYYCASEKGCEVYHALPICDQNLVELYPAETKRDAKAIAEVRNDMYRRQGNLATSNRRYVTI